MNYALKEAHGCGLVTDLRFNMVLLQPWDLPTDYILPPRRGSIWTFLLSVGYHPQLCSDHRYAVLSA